MTPPEDTSAEHTERDAPQAPIPPVDDVVPEDEALADQELLEALRAGDDSCDAVVYQRHRSTALNVARMHTRNVQDAEDLVSEAFAKVLGNIRRGGGPRRFLRAYLVTTIGRLAVEAVEQGRDRGRPSGDDPEPERPAALPEEFNDIVVRQCEAAGVAAAYGSLPEARQAVLWHTEVEAMMPAAVARQLGISPDAVAGLAERARDGLRSAYHQAQSSAPAAEACPECAGSLDAFVSGSLASRRRSEVQNHLDECPRCTAEYLQLQDIGIGMRTWLLPVLAGLPLWGTESKVLAAILASGASTAEATAGSEAVDGAAVDTDGSGAQPADIGSDGSAAPEPESADTAASAEASSVGSVDTAGSGASAGDGAVDTTAVAGSVGLKVAVGALAAAAAVSLVGLGLTTLVQDDDTNRSTTLGGLPFPAGEGGNQDDSADIVVDSEGGEDTEPGADPGTDPGQGAMSSLVDDGGPIGPSTPNGAPPADDVPADATPPVPAEDRLSAFGDDPAPADPTLGDPTRSDPTLLDPAPENRVPDDSGFDGSAGDASAGASGGPPADEAPEAPPGESGGAGVLPGPGEDTGADPQTELPQGGAGGDTAPPPVAPEPGPEDPEPVSPPSDGSTGEDGNQPTPPEGGGGVDDGTGEGIGPAQDGSGTDADNEEPTPTEAPTSETGTPSTPESTAGSSENPAAPAPPPEDTEPGSEPSPAPAQEPAEGTPTAPQPTSGPNPAPTEEAAPSPAPTEDAEPSPAPTAQPSPTPTDDPGGEPTEPAESTGPAAPQATEAEGVETSPSPGPRDGGS